MKTIHKFTISPYGAAVMMPIGAQILTVQSQRGVICAWALVDDQHDMEPRRFRIYGTGNNCADVHPAKYLGTVMFDNETLVLHVFEEVSA